MLIPGRYKNFAIPFLTKPAPWVAPSWRQFYTCNTGMALGKTVAEAKQLQDEDIVAAFQGELVQQTGCPLAGVHALHKALEQYRDNH